MMIFPAKPRMLVGSVDGEELGIHRIRARGALLQAEKIER